MRTSRDSIAHELARLASMVSDYTFSAANQTGNADSIIAALAADGFEIVPVWTGTVRHQVAAAKETK